MSYNGWSNRATWNVNLWLSNDYPMYKKVQEFAKVPETLAYRIKEFCLTIWPRGETPDGDKLSEADFNEIATSWLAE